VTGRTPAILTRERVTNNPTVPHLLLDNRATPRTCGHPGEHPGVTAPDGGYAAIMAIDRRKIAG
jgi:hypothetical protein